MIKLIEISKIYRTSEIETMALDNINLEVREGEFVSIMGPSGCGKSTLLNIAGLLDEPSSGTVELHGKPVSGLNAREAARFRNTELGFVFQSFHLIPSLNVLDNVQMPLLYRRMGATERKERALKMIEAVGLSHRVKHFPSQLSGGQCQRVAIARALVGDPSIILADEPTGNLDSKMGAEVMELLHEVNKQRGKTILMVTHNESQAKQTDRIIRSACPTCPALSPLRHPSPPPLPQRQQNPHFPAVAEAQEPADPCERRFQGHPGPPLLATTAANPAFSCRCGNTVYPYCHYTF